MILVQNRLQPLNGSRIVGLLFLFCVLMVSCDTTKKIKGNTNTPPAREKTDDTKNNRQVVKIDTVQWVDRTPKEDIVVKKETTTESIKKSSYDIGLFLPFGDNVSDNKINDDSSFENRFINYYAGVKMALNDLNSKQVGINVEVLNSKSGDFVSKLESQRNKDLIIGPYDKDKLKFTARFGEENEVPVVAPWQASKDLASDNPYFVQMSPKLENYFQKITEHVISNYSTDQVYILGRKGTNDVKVMSYIQRYASSLDGRGSAKPFKEFHVEEDSLLNGDTAFDNIFLFNRKTVFIIPNYSHSKDESYVYSCVRKLNVEKGANQVDVIGMPLLFESSKINYEHYKNLNLKFCRTNHVDKTKAQLKDFRRRFFDTYGAIPTEDAFEGFDMMTYIGSAIWDLGDKFQNELDSYSANLLQTDFDFQKVYKKNSSRDKFTDIDYIENKGLGIYGFKNNGFVKLQ